MSYSQALQSPPQVNSGLLTFKKSFLFDSFVVMNTNACKQLSFIEIAKLATLCAEKKPSVLWKELYVLFHSFSISPTVSHLNLVLRIFNIVLKFR